MQSTAEITENRRNGQYRGYKCRRFNWYDGVMPKHHSNPTMGILFVLQ